MPGLAQLPLQGGEDADALLVATLRDVSRILATLTEKILTAIDAAQSRQRGGGEPPQQPTAPPHMPSAATTMEKQRAPPMQPYTAPTAPSPRTADPIPEKPVTSSIGDRRTTTPPLPSRCCSAEQPPPPPPPIPSDAIMLLKKSVVLAKQKQGPSTSVAANDEQQSASTARDTQANTATRKPAAKRRAKRGAAAAAEHNTAPAVDVDPPPPAPPTAPPPQRRVVGKQRNTANAAQTTTAAAAMPPTLTTTAPPSEMPPTPVAVSDVGRIKRGGGGCVGVKLGTTTTTTVAEDTTAAASDNDDDDVGNNTGDLARIVAGAAVHHQRQRMSDSDVRQTAVRLAAIAAARIERDEQTGCGESESDNDDAKPAQNAAVTVFRSAPPPPPPKAAAATPPPPPPKAAVKLLRPQRGLFANYADINVISGLPAVFPSMGHVPGPKSQSILAVLPDSSNVPRIVYLGCILNPNAEVAIETLRGVIRAGGATDFASARKWVLELMSTDSNARIIRVPHEEKFGDCSDDAEHAQASLDAVTALRTTVVTADCPQELFLQNDLYIPTKDRNALEPFNAVMSAADNDDGE